MSELKVTVEKVLEVNTHPNADSLDIITIRNWNVIVRKDSFKVNDLGVFFPIDSILPESLEKTIFGEDSKVTLSKGRIKTIKLRGAISQGLFTPFSVLGIKEVKEDSDLTKVLGVTKYEPQESLPSHMQTKRTTSKKEVNPNFYKYTDINNLKNYTNVFTEGEHVYISEKCHGTNVRFGKVLKTKISLFDKILKLFGKFDEYQKVYGSHNVQLQGGKKFNGFYDTNVYSLFANQFIDNLENDVVVYGEIYGPSIQKGYHYGLKNGEFGFVAFDVMMNGRYLGYNEFKNFCDNKGIPRVTELYYGPYSKEVVDSLVSGDSIQCPEQKIREGIVVKPIHERSTYCGRLILKYINPDYLLRKNNTEFH